MTEERKIQYDNTYMKMAIVLSELSYCIKKKVGAILVKDNKIIATGFNGSPAKSFPNNCEDENGKTLWHTIHAESNAITSVAASTQTCQGSTMYITCSPCKECAKLIYQAGVTRVVYDEFYKDLDGVEFLLSAGIIVNKSSKIDNTAATPSQNKISMVEYFGKIQHMVSACKYGNIDDFAEVVLKEYESDIEKLRIFLFLTKECKKELKNRSRVYVHYLQLVSSSDVGLVDVASLQ